MNTEKLKSILLEMKKCGTKRVQFTGGEPMMREDIGEIIRYSKELGFFVGLSTNGHQIAGRLEELKGVDIVFLSYDGPGKAHVSLRGEQNLKEVYSALDCLKKEGIKVWTTTVVTKKNKNSIEDIVRFAKKNKILANFTRLEFVLNSENSLHPLLEDVKELALSEEERKKVFRKLIDLKTAGYPIGCSFPYLYSVLEWPYNNRITDSKLVKRYRCWAGRAYGHLESDGKLYSCGWDSLRGSTGVDVLSKGFKSAWKNLVFSKNCRSCSHACGVENNLLFSLNYASLWNAFKSLKGKEDI
jgi:MoaA/NifB/PqqE/SkfB family radical SAM enzyme